MIWRIGTQFIVQREDVFVIVDATGGVVRRFEPQLASVEDELYRTHYRVVGDELRKHTAVEWRGGPPRVSFERVLAPLVPDASAETARFIATALGDDAVIQEERRLRTLEAADARVAAIEGALAELACGPHVARAQAALRRRVHHWADDDAARLLATLIALARAAQPPHVLAAFANGCLHACFERDVPPLVDGPIVPQPVFAARCAAHATALHQLAEAQAWIDANQTASAYEAAATAIGIAAELLGHCSTTGS